MQTETCLEARAWLRLNSNGSAFATNRFCTTARALEFVEGLYAAGAAEVLVEDPHIDSEGSPYAETLIVRFSGDSWALERFCEEHGAGDVPPGDFTIDVFHGKIRLWWD